jgi:hypothetical protein
MPLDIIQIEFANKILKEEWKEFEDIQDRVIAMRTRRRSGTLRNEHGDRKYGVRNTGAMEVTAGLTHPDYERYLDMKHDAIAQRKRPKKGAKRKAGDLFQDKDRITRKRGRNIHNRIIFGRLNPISFRLMHELRAEVVEEARNIIT